MRNLLFILMALIIIACEKPDEEIEKNGHLVFGNTTTEFSIRDINHKDLLNPENPNSFDHSNIKLFYVIDGETKRVYDSNSPRPRKIKINRHELENEFRASVVTNTSEKLGKSITYIHWNPNDIDTLEITVFNPSPYYISLKKVWLNGKQVFDWDNKILDSIPHFTLIK